MKIEEAKTHIFEIEKLACLITGLDYDEINANEEIIEDKIFEELEIDLGVFQSIVSRLLPLIHISKSPITEEIYKGFANTKKGIWIVKIPES